MKHIGLRFYSDQYDRHWSLGEAHLSIRIFRAIKSTSVLKKLAGEIPRANLNDIKRQIDPESRKWSSDWQYDNRSAFDKLVATGLVEEIQINSGNYGYGEDRGYRLTPEGVKFVQEHREDRVMACYLEEKLLGHRSRWHSYEVE